jgi:hypothetical protein
VQRIGENTFDNRRVDRPGIEVAYHAPALDDILKLHTHSVPDGLNNPKVGCDRAR